MASKAEEMANLRSEARCIEPDVCEPATTIVWGEGNLDAKLVLVGEAPGMQEAKTGRPFVGPAGHLLDRELERAGIQRSEIYITNAVKCRPTQAGPRGVKNRQPSSDEIIEWRDVLYRELEIVSPVVTAALGRIAASVLIGPKFEITKLRGQWFEGKDERRLIATYHPSYLLRADAYGDEEKIIQFRQDLKAIKDAIN